MFYRFWIFIFVSSFSLFSMNDKKEDKNKELESAILLKDLKLLVNALHQGADPRIKIHGRDPALYYVAETWKENDVEEAIRALIAKGADINYNIDGYTALHAAAIYNNIAAVNTLLQLGADPCIRTNLGQTPYDVAKNAEIRALLRSYRCSTMLRQIPALGAILLYLYRSLSTGKKIV